MDCDPSAGPVPFGTKKGPENMNEPAKVRTKILSVCLICIVLVSGCQPLVPDGFSVGVLTTKIPGGPGAPGFIPATKSKQIYGLMLSFFWLFDESQQSDSPIKNGLFENAGLDQKAE